MGRYDALLEMDNKEKPEPTERPQSDTKDVQSTHSHLDVEPPTGIDKRPDELNEKSAPERNDGDRKHEETRKDITSNITSNTTSNITLLSLIDDADIEELREPATQVQSFRLTNRNKEWLQEITYRLNKEIKRNRLTQADVLRVAFKLFEKVYAHHKGELKELIDKIK